MGYPAPHDCSAVDHNKPATDPALAAYGALLMARLMIEAEISANGETYPFADALSLTEDAISQIRGGLKARDDKGAA